MTVKRVVIIGAGGHGREVAELLLDHSKRIGGLSVIGFIDDEPLKYAEVMNDLPVLGDWSWFDGVEQPDVAVICAVGQPDVRKRLVERAILRGLSFVSAISPLAYVSPHATIGKGVMILPNAVASTNSVIGDHAIINVGATVSHESRIGRYGTINPGVHLAGNVTIGEGSFVGVGASVIQGISVGDWSVIGAGAVVTQDLPGHVTAVGVPARVIKNRTA